MQERQQNSFFTRTGGQAFSGPLADTPIENAGSRLAFLRKVYAWMLAGIVATIAGGAIAVKSGVAESLLYAGPMANLMLVLVWAFLPYGVAKVRHVPTWNVVAFALYALFTGFVLSTIILVAMLMATHNGAHAGTYLLQAGGLTLLAFGGITAYAVTTKRNFEFMRGFLMVGSLVLFGAIILGIFLESSALQIAISVAGVLLFSGFVLYDTQKVLRTFPDGEQVSGALTLYLDFVCLFIYMLRLVLMVAGGGRRD